MLDDDGRRMRLGVWVAVAAAVAGLCVLLWHPRVHAETLEPTTRILLEREQTTVQERLAAAEQALFEERVRKSRGLVRTLFDESVGLVSSADPRRIVRASIRLGRTLWKWRERTRAEDEALEQLELGMTADPSSGELQALYAGLREREIDERSHELLESAEDAIEDGLHLLARVRVSRSLELRPEDERAWDLLARLSDPLDEDASRGEGVHDALASGQAVASGQDWETATAAALLAADYEQAADLAGETPRGRLAFAAASYLGGDRHAARDELVRLRERDDPLGSLAREWSLRPDLSAGERFESERRRYYLRKALGVFGGDGLASDGLVRGRRGLDAWRSSLAPLNLALAFPARLVRGWSPDGSALREAASAYLELEPEGVEAEAAQRWLAQLGPAPESHARSPWRGSRLALPKPRTDFTPLSPRPLVLTASALRSGRLDSVELLRDVIGDAEAVLLRVEWDAVPVSTLAGDDSLAMLGSLAEALETGTLESLRGSRKTSFERLQRLEGAVRSGARLVAVPYGVDGPSLRAVLPEAMLEGGTHYADGMKVARGNDKVRVDRRLGGAGFTCPQTVLCVHRPTTVSARLYGSIDTDADMLLGARASFEEATLALEMRSTGPRAQLTLPFARWFGIERWIPVAARVDVGAEGVYVGPIVTADGAGD